MTLFDDGLKILTMRGIEFVDKFIPPLMSSFAVHALNLENRERKFFYMHDRIPDLRLHVLIVSPPGFGRSFILKQLMHTKYGLLNTPQIPMRFEGYCTEAALIGSIERQSNQIIKIKGLFEEYPNGIFGIEEFFSITQAMEQKHSSHMEPALNQALLDGDVRKRLRAGPIEYTTYATMFAGTQTTRFRVGGGLLRRFLLVNWVPTKREKKLMKRAFNRGTNLQLDPQILIDYRSDITNFLKDIKVIDEISFSQDLVDSMEDTIHFTEAVLRKYALGYNLLTQPIESDFVVDIDQRLKLFIDRSERWRKTLVGDPEADMVLTIVRENGGKISWKELKEKMIDFSMRFDASDAIINRVKASKRLYYGNGNLYLPETWRKEKGSVKKVVRGYRT